MIYIVTALQCEARPLVEHFGLQPEHSAKRWRVYASNELTLCVSGVGKLEAAMALTQLLQHCEPKLDWVLNLGICGATPDSGLSIGQWLIANKIHDHGSGRDVYPDILFRHPYKETGVETFDRSVSADTKPAPSLPAVDMEAYGFYQAASHFFAPSRIICVKIVSDFLAVNNCSSAQVEEITRAGLSVFAAWLQELPEPMVQAPTALPDDERQWLDRFAEAHRYTATQRHQLHREAFALYVRRGETPSRALNALADNSVESKYAVNRHFKAASDVLNRP